MAVWEMYQSQLKATGEEISQARYNAAWCNADEPDAAFVNSAVTTVKRVITTRVGSIGITTIMIHFKESFEKVCVVDDP